MELDIISSLIDRNPMLYAKRTGSYLKYVARFWSTNFDTPLRDIDQFRMYLADKNRCNLTKCEQAYSTRCKEISYTVYAALVSEALDAEAPMNIEDIKRRAEKLLQTTPPFPHHHRPACKSRVARCTPICATLREGLGSQSLPSKFGPV